MTLRFDSRWKMSYSDTHIFFLGGPFSQWSESHFRARLPAIPGHCEQSEEMAFNCCEQFMMAGKAWLFGDRDTLAKIMATVQKPGMRWHDVPKAQKALGREVQGFVQEVWDAHCDAIVLAGNRTKFTQSERHRTALLASQGRELVEGASYDRIWGVGLGFDNPKIEDPANWRGLNKLGKTLMVVRGEIA